VDAWSGKVLWSQKLGSGIIGQPMTFLGPDKRQYIAITAGVGGASKVRANVRHIKEIGFPAGGDTTYVFSLDGVSPNTSAGGMMVTPGQGKDSIPGPNPPSSPPPPDYKKHKATAPPPGDRRRS
jgi:hypothetical protein